MSFASKYNKGNRWEVDTTGYDFHAPADLFKKNGADKVYAVKGCYINNKGKYDPAPVIISDFGFINCPAHMVAQFNDILADDTAIADITAGKVGCKVYQYESSNYNRTCYSIQFVDM